MGGAINGYLSKLMEDISLYKMLNHDNLTENITVAPRNKRRERGKG